MKRHRFPLSVIMLGVLWVGPAWAQERMLGLRPCDGQTMFVKRFSVDGGATVTGLEFRNNDPRTVFPEVLLVRGVSTTIGTGTVVAQATNVAESSPGWVRFSWNPSLRAAQAEDYFVAVRFPEGSGKLGEGNGPGIGAVRVTSPGGSFVAGGADGELTPAAVDLTMNLLVSEGGPGKASGDGAARVARMSLSSASPNPFNPSTAIEFGVAQSADVRLSVYDVSGREVRKLLQERLAPGTYRREWDGRDDGRQLVAAGVYVVRLVAGTELLQEKIVLLK